MQLGTHAPTVLRSRVWRMAALASQQTQVPSVMGNTAPTHPVTTRVLLDVGMVRGYIQQHPLLISAPLKCVMARVDDKGANAHLISAPPTRVTVVTRVDGKKERRVDDQLVLTARGEAAYRRKEPTSGCPDLLHRDSIVSRLEQRCRGETGQCDGFPGGRAMQRCKCRVHVLVYATVAHVHANKRVVVISGQHNGAGTWDPAAFVGLAANPALKTRLSSSLVAQKDSKVELIRLDLLDRSIAGGGGGDTAATPAIDILEFGLQLTCIDTDRVGPR